MRVIAIFTTVTKASNTAASITTVTVAVTVVVPIIINGFKIFLVEDVSTIGDDGVQREAADTRGRFIRPDREGRGDGRGEGGRGVRRKDE
jgi:hypothetical protein